MGHCFRTESRYFSFLLPNRTINQIPVRIIISTATSHHQFDAHQFAKAVVTFVVVIAVVTGIVEVVVVVVTCWLRVTIGVVVTCWLRVTGGVVVVDVVVTGAVFVGITGVVDVADEVVVTAVVVVVVVTVVVGVVVVEVVEGGSTGAGGTGTVIDREILAVLPVISVALMVKLKVPGVFGEPVIAPVVAASDRPPGNEPEVTAQV